MKRILQVLALILIFKIGNAQPGFNRVHPVSWQDPPYNYTAKGYLSNIFCIDRVNDFYDGYLAFGYGILCRPGDCVNYTRSYSVKFNLDGELMWSNDFEEDGVDMNSIIFGFDYNGMTINHRDHYVGMLTEFTVLDEFAESNIDYLTEYDWSGQELNRIVIDTMFQKYLPYGIAENFIDSTYLVCGWLQDSVAVINNIEPDGYLMKLDTLGNRFWEQTYDNTFAVLRVIADGELGYWLIATEWGEECAQSFAQNDRCIIIRTDANGNELDRVVKDGSCGLEEANIVKNANGEFILGGFLTNPEFDEDCSVWAGYLYTQEIEFNPMTNEIVFNTDEEQSNRRCGEQYMADFQQTIDGGYAFGGWEYSAPFPAQKATLVKLDENRDSLWHKEYLYYASADNFTEHYLMSFQSTPDSGFVCAGYVSQGYDGVPNPNLDVPWIFKTDKYGCLEPGCNDVGVSEIVIGLQNTMSLYPNPATTIANIAFSFPADYSPPKNSELVVIDMQGREVLRQNIIMFGRANASIDMDVSKLTSGVYTVHWVSENAWLDSVRMVKE